MGYPNSSLLLQVGIGKGGDKALLTRETPSTLQVRDRQGFLDGSRLCNTAVIGCLACGVHGVPCILDQRH